MTLIPYGLDETTGKGRPGTGGELLTGVDGVPLVADIPDGTEAAKGKVQFAPDGGVNALEAVQGDDSRLVASAASTWLDPVDVREVIGSITIAGLNGLGAPIRGDAYVATDAGTPTVGSSDALVAGSVTEFNGTEWKKIITGSGGFPPAGTRGLASTQTALNGTIGLVDATDDGKILDWDGTSLTPTKTTLVDGNTLAVRGDDSVFENRVFIFDGTVPTGIWVNASLSLVQNTLFSADLGSGTTFGNLAEDFVFGIGTILFAVPFIATVSTILDSRDLVRITAVALNTPDDGTVRVSYTLSGDTDYGEQLAIGCSAFA